MSAVNPDQHLPDAIQLVVRMVEGKKQMVVCIRRGDSAKETAKRIAVAQFRYNHLKDEIHHIELEQLPSQAAVMARAKMKRLRKRSA